MRAGRLTVFAFLLLWAGMAAAQEYQIAGRVLNAVSGSPLIRAEVALSVVDDDDESAPAQERPQFRGRRQRGPATIVNGRNVLATATTGEDGEFRFPHLAAGKYALVASKRGYLSASYDEHEGYSTAIVTGPGLDSDGLAFKLSPGAVISGTLSDASGDPIEQGNVMLFRQQEDGLGSVKQYRSLIADDTGAYEFDHLPTGTYFLAGSARVWYATPPRQQTNAPSDLDVAYPLDYYPGTTDSATAAPIAVRGGEHLTLDLALHAEPAVHLTLALPQQEAGEDGRTRNFPVFPLATQKAFGEPIFTRSSEGFQRLGGNFQGSSVSFSVAPGQYEIDAGGRELAIDATGDVRVDPAAAAPLATVSGKVALARGGTLPDDMVITLRRTGGSDVQVQGQVADSGMFSIETVPAETYEVSLLADGHLYSVTQMAAKGAVVDGSLVKVGTDGVTLAATVSQASGRVSGFVQRNGKGVGGAMVVLVPKQESAHGLYRRDQSDSDGSFVLRDVAPGAYTVVAIENGWDVEWARPGVISRYLRGGLEATVGDGSRLALKEAVEPQPR